MELHVLKTNMDEDQTAVIDVLEDVLKEAREGKVRAVAIAVVRPDLALNTTWPSCSSVGPLIGGVALLQHRLIEALDK